MITVDYSKPMTFESGKTAKYTHAVTHTYLAETTPLKPEEEECHSSLVDSESSSPAP